MNFDVKHEKEYYDDTKNIENIKNIVFAKWKDDGYSMEKILEEMEKYELPDGFNHLDYSDLNEDLKNAFGTNYSCLVRH